MTLLKTKLLPAYRPVSSPAEDTDVNEFDDKLDESFEDIEFDKLDRLDDLQDLWENDDFPNHLDEFLDELQESS